MSSFVIKVKDVWKIYQNGGEPVPVLQGVGLDVRQGESLLVRGPSGSGKSTLLKLMGLLDVPSKGSILIDEIDTTKLSQNDKAKIRNKKIGFVFQSFNLIPELSVYENVMLPTWIGGKHNGGSKKEALTLLKMVGLEGKKRSLASQLSGGQMQRVAIARALVNQPSVLLADEPTGNLDSKNALQVMDLFKRMKEENRQTIVLISHDSKHERDADRVLTLIDGQINNGQQRD